MKKIFIAYVLFTSVIGTILMFSSYSSKAEEPAKETEVVHSLPQIIKSIPLDKQFTFAGEIIPQTFDARERLDRELSVNAYWHSSTTLNMKNASRHFAMMDRVLTEYGVPTDFKYLAVAESNLRNVVSSASAKGFWQFRKLAAKEFGLEVNDEVDERYHAEKATIAAAKYLKQLHKRWGNWIDAAASYNIGPTRYSKLRKAQGEENYFNMHLTDETSRYVFRLVAIKEIMSNPDIYGFYLENGEKYHDLPPFREIAIDKSVSNWGAFADGYGVSYREFKLYNPWLIDTKLTVINNKYKVKVPIK